MSPCPPEEVLDIWEAVTQRVLTDELRQTFLNRTEVTTLQKFSRQQLIAAAEVVQADGVLRLERWVQELSKRMRRPPKRADQRNRTGNFSYEANKRAAGFTGYGPQQPADADLHKFIGPSNPGEYGA